MGTSVVSKPTSRTSEMRLRFAVGVPLAVLVFAAVMVPNALAAIMLLIALPIAFIELLNVTAGIAVPVWLAKPLRLAKPKQLVPWKAMRFPLFVLIGGLMSFVSVAFQSTTWAMLVLLSVYATDTWALLVGRLTGLTYKLLQPGVPDELQRKPRQFAPVISPKKTWAGTIGGVVGSTLMTAIVVSWPGFILRPSFSLYVQLFVASVAAVLGDLLESHIKRLARVKDMSVLIPGHGGVMERLDSLTASFLAVVLSGAILQIVDMAAPQLQLM